METLSSIAVTIGALLTFATAVVNLVTAVRTRRSGGQQLDKDGEHADR